MEELILNIHKDIPFTLAMAIIFWRLSERVLSHARQDNSSKDALIGRLIDLLEKLSGVVDSLEKKLDTLQETMDGRTEAIVIQTVTVKELRDEVIKLREYIDAETRIQRPPNTGTGQKQSPKSNQGD